MTDDIRVARRHLMAHAFYMALRAEVHGWSWLALEQFTYALRPMGSGVRA